jgi:hypothetical protein
VCVFVEFELEVCGIGLSTLKSATERISDSVFACQINRLVARISGQDPELRINVRTVLVSNVFTFLLHFIATFSDREAHLLQPSFLFLLSTINHKNTLIIIIAGRSSNS